MTTHADLKRLEVLGILARKASTGTRTFEQMADSIKIELDGGDWLHIDTYGAEDEQIEQALSDAAFIAAANPATILALLARVESAESDAEKLSLESHYWLSKHAEATARIADLERRLQIGLASPAEEAIENQKLFGNEHTTPMVRVEAAKYAALLARVERLERIEAAALQIKPPYISSGWTQLDQDAYTVPYKNLRAALASPEQEKP